MIEQTGVETSILGMTPTAASKVHELLAQENDPSLGLRIFVAGGGCSGLQYGMTLDEEQDGEDSDAVHRNTLWKRYAQGLLPV